MILSLYQIDAFADTIFSGNPAAICPLDEWLSDKVMQAIAAENNLSETAFYVKTDDGFQIRWFTPNTEVVLCGHATLACAYLLFEILDYPEDVITFQSQSGLLTVTRKNKLLTLNFPTQLATKCELPEFLNTAFNSTYIECLKSEDYILVFKTEQEIIEAKPNLEKLMKNDLRGVIITAPSNQYDFVCRFFAPNCGIDEDPVTGSAFTQLTPYWANQLSKKILTAKQVSNRGGEVWLEEKQDRILISGKAVLYMKAEISI